VGWSSRSIVGAQVVVEPPSAAPSVSVHSLHVESFTGTTIEQVPVPPVVVRAEVLDIPPP